jgi:hypothetical protein
MESCEHASILMAFELSTSRLNENPSMWIDFFAVLHHDKEITDIVISYERKKKFVCRTGKDLMGLPSGMYTQD